MKNETKWRIVWILLTIIFAIDMVISYFGGPKKTEVKSSIPPPDMSRDPRVYDFYQDRWVYGDEEDRRANGIYCPPPDKGLTEEDIQEFLEDHIDGYKEDTYWGEEWDEPEKY